MVPVISSEEFKQWVFDYEKHSDWVFEGAQPLIVNFTASWCGPCRAFAPILEQVAEDWADKLKVYKVDIDKSPEVASLFGVMSVPTTLFIGPHELPAMASGMMLPDDIKRAIQDVLRIE
jgi:thioredoxin 1